MVKYLTSDCEESLMQKLSDVPFDLLRVGDRVKSEITNNEGVIRELILVQDAYRTEDNQIVINWDTGYRYRTWQFWLDQIWLM